MLCVSAVTEAEVLTLGVICRLVEAAVAVVVGMSVVLSVVLVFGGVVVVIVGSGIHWRVGFVQCNTLFSCLHLMRLEVPTFLR